MKPLIGITASMSKDSTGLFSGTVGDYLNNAYSKAVSRAGGVPVIIPINTDPENVAATLSKLDGLILSGGEDAAPFIFNEEPLSKLGFTYPERDYAEIEIINKAMEIKMPILGICRGMQFINSVLGGTLYQDLSYFSEDALKHFQNAYPDDVSHSISIEKDSVLKEIFGDNNMVNSFHHQLIKDPAPIFKVTAKAADGAIEAIEHKDMSHFILAVQFHPELLSSKLGYCQGIFDRFITEVIANRDN